MITGKDLKDIRALSGMGNQQLATILDESLSTINRWLANGVRPEKEAKVRERLAQWLPPTEPDRYTRMSDAALIAEMTRLLGILGQRLADRDESHDPVDDSPDSIEPRNNGPEVGGTAGPPTQPSAPTQRRIRGRGPRRNLGQ